MQFNLMTDALIDGKANLTFEAIAKFDRGIDREPRCFEVIPNTLLSIQQVP